MAKRYITTFKVKGSGYFPFDMLRYDSCTPSSSQDAAELSWHSFKDDEPRIVKLQCNHEGKEWTPTEARWRSFGWTVLPDSIRTIG